MILLCSAKSSILFLYLCHLFFIQRIPFHGDKRAKPAQDRQAHPQEHRHPEDRAGTSVSRLGLYAHITDQSQAQSKNGICGGRNQFVDQGIQRTHSAGQKAARSIQLIVNNVGHHGVGAGRDDVAAAHISQIKDNGQPEIIPAQADAIQMMFQSYLNGDSLFKIKEALENKGILTATGKKEWTTQAILRILQNEKYMGDVLLQKTFTANFLEGKPRKNNGEMPQYYIENNHPAIVTREVFHRVQEEIARRKSKRPASQKKSKTNRGKFTSQYALSERLVCGTCGCYYRRVTWNIHGRKQIVWRCINRLEFGKRYCGNSPSIPEEALHAAIVKSIQSLLDGRQEELASCLQETIENYWCDDAATSPLAVQNKLDRLNREFDRLLLLIGDEENVFLEKKLQKINNEILSLKQEVKYTERQNVQNRDKMDKLREVMELLSAENMEITEYSDVLVCRLIEQITVLSKTEIRIRFVGGYEVEQKLLI